MADETTGAATPDTGATPAIGATPVPSPAAEPQPATGEGSPEAQATEPELGEGGNSALQAERTARRDAERRAKAAEKALKEKEDAELSEAQKQAKRLADLEAEKATWEQERQTVYLTAAVSDLSPKLGLVDVDAVTRLLDRSAVEFDESGRPTNAEELVRALVRSKPYLAGGRPQPPVGTNATEGTTSGPAPVLTADELEAAKATGMSPERYAALKGVRTVEDWQATRRPPGQA